MNVQRAPGRCALGGDHRTAETEAFKLAFNYGKPLRTISCFPERLWDHGLIDKYSARGWTPLHVALAAGDLPEAEKHLKKGVAATVCTTDGIQPLLCVVENYALLDEDALLKAFRFLRFYGAELNCTDSEGNLLVCRVASLGAVKILDYIFENGVDVNISDRSGRNLLHHATKANVVDFLIARGVDPSAADAEGRLAVHNAARWGHEEAVEALLPYSGQDARDRNGDSPLHLAARRGHFKVVELLVSRHPDFVGGMDVRADSKDSLQAAENPLGKELESEDSPHPQVPSTERKGFKYSLDIDAKNVEGCTAVHLAVGNSHFTVTEILLNSGADSQAQDNRLQTPLNYVFLSHLDPFSAQNFVKLLLESGANPNHRDEDGTTLHRAIKAQWNEVLLILLQHEARVDLTDASGRTALHLAAGRGNALGVEKLLDFNAEPMAQDNQQQTPLNYLFHARQLWSSKYEEMYKIAHMLLKAGADSNRLDATGSSPLHHALAMEHREVVLLLLNHKAHFNTKDSAKVHNDHEIAVNYLIKKDTLTNCRYLVVQLLMAGLDPDQRNASGSTLLHRAAKEGAWDIVQLLLRWTSNLDLKDDSGRTALHLAARNGAANIVKLLLAHGADASALDCQQRTALNYAQEGESEEREATIELLMQATADPNCADVVGVS